MSPAKESGAAKVLVVGSGKRVREAALPAFARMADKLYVERIYAKHAKTLEVAGVRYIVERFTTLTPADLEGIELIYLAVSKNVVPRVLATLVEAGVGGVDLLIDTPVVRFKHYRHVGMLARFRNAWVSEDCIALPWFDVLRRFLAEHGATLERVDFHQSAYAYHGVATAKELLGSRRVTHGRRRKTGADNGAVRELAFANGTSASMLEPRDYPTGRVVLTTTSGVISERAGEGDHLLAPITGADGEWIGFRIGEVESALDEDEVALLRATAPPAPGTTITSRMEDLKRVGFLRLLRAITSGAGTYPATEAIDDMVVDYHLEKFGLYFVNPFTSPRSGLGRFLLRALTRVGG